MNLTGSDRDAINTIIGRAIDWPSWDDGYDGGPPRPTICSDGDHGMRRIDFCGDDAAALGALKVLGKRIKIAIYIVPKCVEIWLKDIIPLGLSGVGDSLAAALVDAMVEKSRLCWECGHREGVAISPATDSCESGKHIYYRLKPALKVAMEGKSNG